MLLALCFVAKYPDDEFTIYSDSAYVVNICNNWIKNWANNNWTRGPKHLPIENLELIQSIYNYITKNLHNFQIKHVSAHSKIKGNEMADKLAKGKKVKLQSEK